MEKALALRLQRVGRFVLRVQHVAKAGLNWHGARAATRCCRALDGERRGDNLEHLQLAQALVEGVTAGVHQQVADIAENDRPVVAPAAFAGIRFEGRS